MRSGTASMARIFNLNHETWFGFNSAEFTDNEEMVRKHTLSESGQPGEIGTLAKPSNIAHRIAKEKPDNESSWLIVPFLNEVQDYTKVIQVVRHPINVINSLINLQIFNDDYIPSVNPTRANVQDYRNYIYNYLPGIKNIKNVFAKATFYYIYWNQKLIKLPKIRIEDIINCPHLNAREKSNYSIEEILERIGDNLACELLGLMENYRYKK